MRFTATSIAAALLTLRPVAADFMIFYEVVNQIPDPAQFYYVELFNNPPGCDSPGQGADSNYYNDASGGGFACDGCDISQQMVDWDITRFEFNDSKDTVFAGPAQPYHITIYQDQADTAKYGIFDTDMNLLGSCIRPADPQYLECPVVFASGYAIFECTSELSIQDSN